ncbi:hypothetical protein TNCV_2834591 [Trichonephila clavipes]|nr:hypothetical protein TNCV_2834591 [Trichonephila clavipes]
MFPGQWTEREIPIAWSPRHLDIIPLEFSLQAKNIVLQSPISNADELKSRISVFIQKVDLPMLHRTWS